MPLLAAIMNGYTPAVPDAGMPANVAVPLPLFVKVTPAGSVPAAVIVAAAGAPLVRIMNVAAAPMVKVAALALVIVGAEVWAGDACPYVLSPQQTTAPSSDTAHDDA